MRERPILFSPQMSRAIRDGRKTTTRRIVKPQPHPTCAEGGCGWDWHYTNRDDHKAWNTSPETLAHQMRNYCPYGKVGQRLWVRETWADLRGGGFEKPFAYLADSLNQHGEEDGEARRCREDYGYKWRPSIFMPREACRTILEITGIRAERLQAIDEADARAEGVKSGVAMTPGGSIVPTTATWQFMKLWDQINGDSAPWDSNPFVWVVSFKKLEVLNDQT